MAVKTKEIKTPNHQKGRSDPPGKIKITDALKTLLKGKDFNNGEIRDDISSWHMMQVVLGGIEHYILPCLIFDRKLK